jgi:hypothetical protein
MSHDSLDVDVVVVDQSHHVATNRLIPNQQSACQIILGAIMSPFHKGCLGWAVLSVTGDL